MKRGNEQDSFWKIDFIFIRLKTDQVLGTVSHFHIS